MKGIDRIVVLHNSVYTCCNTNSEVVHARGRLSIHAMFPNSPVGNWNTRSREENGAYCFLVNSIVTLAAAALPVAL